MRAIRRAAAACLLVVLTAHASAEEIRIGRLDCASGVHLVARDAPLSEVLQQLARALDFQLRYQSEFDPHVTLDASLAPVELVARVAQSMNFTVMQARSTKCPRQQRILKVVVLSGQGGRVSRPAAAPTATPPSRETAEQARRAKEGLDAFLRSHGQGPSPPAAKGP